MTMQNSHDDRSSELDLVDIWLFFLRYWKVLAAFSVAGAVLGASYAFISVPIYQFRTLIEIGTQIVGDEVKGIESPQSVKAKIEEGYLTMALREYYQLNPDRDEEFEVSTSIPKNSDVLVISSEAPESDEDALRAIHSGVVQRLVADHNRIMDLIRQDLRTQLVEVDNQLEALVANAAFLEAEQERLAERHENEVLSIDQQISLTQTELARLEEENRNRLAMLDEQISLRRVELGRLDQAEALVEGQIQELETLLRSIQGDRAKAIGEAKDEARAMTMLLIHNQIQQAGRQLAELKERRDVAIPNQRSGLEKEIQDLEKQKTIVTGELANKRDRLASQLDEARRDRADQVNQLQAERERFAESIAENKRSQRLLQAGIDELSLRIENLKATSAPVVASQSVRPVGASVLVIAAIAIMLASVFGAIFVTVLELSKQANTRALRATPDTGSITGPDYAEPASSNWPAEPHPLKKAIS